MKEIQIGDRFMAVLVAQWNAVDSDGDMGFTIELVGVPDGQQPDLETAYVHESLIGQMISVDVWNKQASHKFNNPDNIEKFLDN